MNPKNSAKENDKKKKAVGSKKKRTVSPAEEERINPLKVKSHQHSLMSYLSVCFLNNFTNNLMLLLQLNLEKIKDLDNSPVFHQSISDIS